MTSVPRPRRRRHTLHQTTDAARFCAVIAEVSTIIGIDDLAAPISIVWVTSDSQGVLRLTVHPDDIDAWAEQVESSMGVRIDRVEGAAREHVSVSGALSGRWPVTVETYRVATGPVADRGYSFEAAPS